MKCEAELISNRNYADPYHSALQPYSHYQKNSHSRNLVVRLTTLNVGNESLSRIFRNSVFSQMTAALIFVKRNY